MFILGLYCIVFGMNSYVVTQLILMEFYEI